MEDVCLEKSGSVELLAFLELAIGLSSFGYVEDERLELLTTLFCVDCGVFGPYGPV